MKIKTLAIALSVAALTLTGCPAPKKTGTAPKTGTPAASAPAKTGTPAAPSTPAATPAKTGE